VIQKVDLLINGFVCEFDLFVVCVSQIVYSYHTYYTDIYNL